jgi:hypothetical protein
MSEKTQGRRADSDEEFWADPPGVWWRWDAVNLSDGGPPVVRWMIRPSHEIEEHEDGAITVEAKPSNSNSILCPFCGWHGYIEHGVWRSV